MATKGYLPVQSDGSIVITGPSVNPVGSSSLLLLIGLALLGIKPFLEILKGD